MKPDSDITFERVKKFISKSKGELISGGVQKFLKNNKPIVRKQTKNPDAVIKTVGDFKRALEGIPDDVKIIGPSMVGISRVVKIKGNLRRNLITVTIPVEEGPEKLT